MFFIGKYIGTSKDFTFAIFLNFEYLNSLIRIVLYIKNRQNLAISQISSLSEIKAEVEARY